MYDYEDVDLWLSKLILISAPEDAHILKAAEICKMIRVTSSGQHLSVGETLLLV